MVNFFSVSLAGQATANRLKKQVEKTSRCVNNTIARYNKNDFCTDYKLPKKIARKDALNPEYYIYFQDEPCRGR